MRCNTCQIDLADTARFCNICGASLVSSSQQESLVMNGGASAQGVGAPPPIPGVGMPPSIPGVPPSIPGGGSAVAGFFNDLDWRGVQYGAGALAIALVVGFLTQMKGIAEHAYNNGVQMDLTGWYITWVALSAVAGMVDVHYSRTRLPKEAAVAGAIGMVAAVIIVSVLNPTANTLQGEIRMFRFDFGLLVRDAAISAVAAGLGAHWYADWLRKQGR